LHARLQLGQLDQVSDTSETLSVFVIHSCPFL